MNYPKPEVYNYVNSGTGKKETLRYSAKQIYEKNKKINEDLRQRIKDVKAGNQTFIEEHLWAQNKKLNREIYTLTCQIADLNAELTLKNKIIRDYDSAQKYEEELLKLENEI